jgi:hypothetical protein
MNTKVSIVLSIIAITAAVLPLATSPVVTTHEAIAATAPIIVNPPTTIVNPCPLGTIPETTTTGTVCLLIPGGGYGYETGFGPHSWYHPWHHHLY